MKDKNQVMFPIDFTFKIAEDDPVRKVVEICESLDDTELVAAYVRKWRSIHPITMLELLVFGYMTNRYSTRDIEEACRTDIRFLWILQDEPAPDHSTIARFQNERLVPIIEKLFYQIIEKLMQLDDISYPNVFIDGTKIEANANRYSFVWIKSVEKNAEKLNERIAKELPELARRNKLNANISLENCLDVLETQFRALGQEFVSGRGNRKTALQRDIEKLRDFVQRKEKYAAYMAQFQGRKSFSKTDPDATFMRMKDDHMRNGQLKPGYNVQIAVESEYIVGFGLFPNPNDLNTLVPFLERMKAHTGRTIENVVADAGYESEENYLYLQSNGQNAYIKPNDFERQKTRKYRENIYRADTFPYDEKTDTYRCPNGIDLQFEKESKKITSSGFTSVKRHYRAQGCAACPHRADCYKGAYENREISLSQTFAALRENSRENITTPQGILLRMNRSIQVEGAFGVLKQDFGFRQFLTRGTQKTQTQFFLLAIAFNIQKLCNRQKHERLGRSLFEKQIA